MSRARRVAAAVAGSLAVTAVVTGSPALAHTKTTTTSTTTALPGVTAATPLRIAASPVALTDGTGRAVFTPDSGYAVGGRLVTSGDTISGTSSPLLYDDERTGVSGYNVPVSGPGTYFVDLFVAETRGAAPGQRVWSVTAEGQTVVGSVDVARDAGADHEWHVVFAVAVTDGTLNLHINPISGTPMVGAVEVDFQKSATTQQELFGENFDGPAGAAPDPTRWTADTGGNGWGNNELETYTDRTANASLDGAGHLDITARQETYTGTDGITRNYTSARLKTAGKFQFQYGSAEARIQVPAGQGMWPAFWTLGSNIATVGWPICGEMDILENRGSEPDVAHATLHAGGRNGISWLAANETSAPTALSGGYHTFGLVWGPTAVSMSLDGRPYMTESASDITAEDWWNFSQPNFLLLNLAVGGTWAGAPDATTTFPAVMSVDYVHVVG